MLAGYVAQELDLDPIARAAPGIGLAQRVPAVGALDAAELVGEHSEHGAELVIADRHDADVHVWRRVGSRHGADGGRGLAAIGFTTLITNLVANVDATSTHVCTT